jgi:hypothetical protein
LLKYLAWIFAVKALKVADHVHLNEVAKLLAAQPRRLSIHEGGDPRLPIDLLHPFDSDKMKMLPANPAVGNANNNGPEMLDEADSLSGSL